MSATNTNWSAGGFEFPTKEARNEYIRMRRDRIKANIAAKKAQKSEPQQPMTALGKRAREPTMSSYLNTHTKFIAVGSDPLSEI